MLGHAIRHELDDLAALVRAKGSETLVSSLPLCLFASACIAINVSDRWPTDADLREIAKRASESATELESLSRRSTSTCHEWHWARRNSMTSFQSRD
jgi:hypothetical protein